MGATRSLAQFVSQMEYEALPSELLCTIKKSLLDSIGCALAGSSSTDIGKICDALDSYGGGRTAPVVGRHQAVSLPLAILLNSYMCHVLEMDDLHKPSKVHPGAVVAMGILTCAADTKMTGKEALVSITAGYETMIRVGQAMGTVSHRQRGWHATATCGAIGMAAAYGKGLDLTADQLCNAFGLAGSQSAGLMAFLADGSSAKRFQVAKSAQNGWMAARLAGKGLTGPISVLEYQDGGLLRAMSDNYCAERITNGLGSVYESMRTGIKLHACCGHTHQAIDAALALRAAHRFAAEDIAAVEVQTYDVSGVSWGTNGMPKNAVEGQFNFPYVIATALIDGRVSLGQFSAAHLQDPIVFSLAQRVRVTPEQKYTERYPAQWCAAVTIRLKDGRVLTKEALGAKGDGNEPLTFEEVEEKFCNMTEGILTDGSKRLVCQMVQDIDDLHDMNKLLTILSTAVK